MCLKEWSNFICNNACVRCRGRYRWCIRVYWGCLLRLVSCSIIQNSSIRATVPYHILQIFNVLWLKVLFKSFYWIVCLMVDRKDVLPTQPRNWFFIESNIDLGSHLHSPGIKDVFSSIIRHFTSLLTRGLIQFLLIFHLLFIVLD